MSKFSIKFVVVAVVLGVMVNTPALAGKPGGVPAPGSLDTTFDTDGIVIGPLGDGKDIAIQSDGKIVAAGGNGTGFTVARYLNGGALDSTFGSGGAVTTSIGDFGAAGINGIAIQDAPDPLDIKIIAGGTAFFSSSTGGASGYQFALARYNANGTLDTTFGTGGIVTTDFSLYGDDVIVDIALQQNGYIVVAGYIYGSNFVIARYDTDGILDNGFGTNGVVMVDIPGSELVKAVTLQGNNIVAVGYTNTGVSNDDFAVVRLTSTGEFDPSFSGGYVITDLYGSWDQASDIAIDGSNIVVVGLTQRTNTDFAIVRYLSNGTLDGGFGTGGKAAVDFGIFNDMAESVAIQSDGKIVVSGAAATRFNTKKSRNFYDFHFATARFNSNGTLDTFGTGGDGKVITPVGPTGDLYLDDYAYAIALQADGKIVVGGRTADSTGVQFGLVRYNP